MCVSKIVRSKTKNQETAALEAYRSIPMLLEPPWLDPVLMACECGAVRSSQVDPRMSWNPLASATENTCERGIAQESARNLGRPWTPSIFQLESWLRSCDVPALRTWSRREPFSFVSTRRRFHRLATQTPDTHSSLTDILAMLLTAATTDGSSTTMGTT